MKELEIGDRLEFEDGRGATVLGKYPSYHYLNGYPLFMHEEGRPTTGYTLWWDPMPDKGNTRIQAFDNTWRIDQEYLEECNMRIVKKVE